MNRPVMSDNNDRVKNEIGQATLGVLPSDIAVVHKNSTRAPKSSARIMLRIWNPGVKPGISYVLSQPSVAQTMMAAMARATMDAPVEMPEPAIACQRYDVEISIN